MLYEVLLEVEGHRPPDRRGPERGGGGAPPDADYSVLWVTMKDAA